MIELGKTKREVIRPLCEQEDAVMVRGALEGSMGRVWVPELAAPSYCLIVLGEFAWLFGICPRGEDALELKSLLYRACSRGFLTPSDERWADWIEDTFAGEYRMLTRYAMKKDKNCFKENQLEEYASCLPEGVRIHPVDKRLYQLALKEEWSQKFCSNFESSLEFEKDGLGFVAMEGKKLVSGCSASGVSQGMMEMEVATRKDYRGKGLAMACSARFILSCLERGIYPNWNASSQQSAELASRLGYLFDKEYEVYQLIQEDHILLDA